MTTGWRRWAPALLPVASLALSLLLAEAVLRWVYAPAALRVRMQLLHTAGPDAGSDAALAFDARALRFAPGSRTTLSHAEYVTPVAMDAHGYRDPCPLAAPARVVLVGDSFVFGIGVDDASTLQCLLNAARPTYALGIPGAGPSEYARLLARNVPALVRDGTVAPAPLQVVALFMGNDFEDLLEGAPASSAAPAPPGAAHRLNELVFRDWPTRGSWLLNLLKIAATQRGILRRPESPDYVRLHSGSTLYRATVDAGRRARMVEQVAGRLRMLQRAGEGTGGRVVFLVLPDVNGIDPARARNSLLLLGEVPAHFALAFKGDVLREAAARAGVTEVDAYPCFGTAGAGRYYYVADNHLTPRGTRRLVACVGDRLAQLATAP